MSALSVTLGIAISVGLIILVALVIYRIEEGGKINPDEPIEALLDYDWFVDHICKKGK